MGQVAFHGHPDHDACGTGFVVQLGKPASHEVVERALVALQRLSHRGGVDSDGCSGDGAGLLTAVPQPFIRRAAKEVGIDLPDSFALGMVFLPCREQESARKAIEGVAGRARLKFLGWRPVPTDVSVLGQRSAETLPSVWQFFLDAESEAAGADGTDFERQLFLFRKQAEAETPPGVYFCSLSTRTVVYKGLLTPSQLPAFYPDLASPDFESSFAIFHQRYSTNTQPTWSLAQPFRFLAHNGEINTIVGNRRWMRARESEIRGALNAGEWFRALEERVSDSANLDNALELLQRQGFSAEAGMLTLVPPAFESNLSLTPEIRDFFQSVAFDYEPWDGPAALVFSDGRVVGAKLDRNGLRPLRYTRTSDGLIVAGSEVGIADFDGKEVIERQRLGPGEMLLVDTIHGQVMRGGELAEAVARQQRHRRGKRFAHVRCENSETVTAIEEPKRMAAALGWTEDQFRILFQPLAEGKEAIWSMGDDAPPAFMSKMQRTLWDYCKQRFAQVTNPAIDPLRETHVMSLELRAGPDLVLESPVLHQGQARVLTGKLAPVQRIDMTFDADEGVAGGLRALDRIRKEALGDNNSGNDGPKLVWLNDRLVRRERAALPVLLATSAVWQSLVAAGNFRTPLVVETAQAFDTHHIALLIAAGANAVCPFLALQFAEAQKPGGAGNYCKAVRLGLLKVLSRMGISTMSSYRNSQLFEVVGLDQELTGEFFADAAQFAGEKSLTAILQDRLQTHALAFAVPKEELKDGGFFRYRKQGERHGTSPELLRKLHAYLKKPEPQSYKEFEEIRDHDDAIAVRGLLEIASRGSIDKGEVEPEKQILRRFSTQAMSLGAISPEAHRTLALAMNRLGARSNTGEGGEDPQLYRTDRAATNRVKQVASARFGVTTEYLVHADEIEIKIAQGSKPGEGGQLPATKVSAYIARLRHAVPGMSLISPPPHHDIYSIEDLAQLIYDLREVNPNARIGVKLVSSAGVGIIAAGVAKAGADVITISGHDGGTGASPLSSIKNTGLPWEIGLRDTHRILTEMGLRSRVRLRVDGGFKFARDVVAAALLGADEFGFGTAALLAIGCVMARQCHLNTCPVGIATQDETLRTRFSGSPEMVITYFQGVAQGVRELLARVGARSIGEIVGDTTLLKPRVAEGSSWLEELIVAPKPNAAPRPDTPVSRLGLQRKLAAMLGRREVRSLKGRFAITNADRSIGANFSGEILRRSGRSKSKPSFDFEFRGTAGQSFGAFLVSGVNFRLFGEANDYVGKGLSGGTIAITAGDEASFRHDVLAGNTVLYGATSGELYIAGRAGERFAVRNSGALAVVEGVGDHGCEYMTGGVAVILGPTGINLGSGMTGGLAYVLKNHFSVDRCNSEFVVSEAHVEEDEMMLRRVLARHQRLTGSPRAARLLALDTGLPFVRLQPLKLPCSIELTWQPILDGLEGLPSPISEKYPAAVVDAGPAVF